MTDSQVQETQVMEGVRAGDVAALLSLYRSLRPAVFRFTPHMSGSRSVSGDFTQEVFPGQTRAMASRNLDAVLGRFNSFLG